MRGAPRGGGRGPSGPARPGGGGVEQQPTATWSARQENLALHLAAGRPIKRAAEEAGVGERTAHTWLEDPAYRAYTLAVRGRLLDQAAGKLAAAAGEAVETLRALLGDESAAVRLRAASGLLHHLLRVREHVEFEGR